MADKLYNIKKLDISDFHCIICYDRARYTIHTKVGLSFSNHANISPCVLSAIMHYPRRSAPFASHASLIILNYLFPEWIKTKLNYHHPNQSMHLRANNKPLNPYSLLTLMIMVDFSSPRRQCNTSNQLKPTLLCSVWLDHTGLVSHSCSIDLLDVNEGSSWDHPQIHALRAFGSGERPLQMII